MDTFANETKTTSPKQATSVYTVDSFNNGIAFGLHRPEPEIDSRYQYRLQISDDASVVKLRSRYLLNKSNPLDELELHLMKLSQQGVLGSSLIYFGTNCDPFFPFDGKFDASMKFLELFKRYTPGQLVIQTRSPLIVIAMPILTALGKRASVTIGLETSCEENARRFTPSLPKVKERLQAARALRRFGIEVNIQVAPLLPYGDWRKDADKFAKLLVETADHIYVSPIHTGGAKGERRIKGSPLARSLAAARKFHWLRPDAANPLISAIEEGAPEKLKMPKREHLEKKQMDIFAA